MSEYGEAFTTHMAEKLNSSVEDVMDALATFTFTPNGTPKKGTAKSSVQKTTPKAAPKVTAKSPIKTPAKTIKTPQKSNDITAKTTAKKTPAKKNTDNDHTCERIKKGQTDVCGKKALRSLGDGEDEHWYCGTEKAGCYHSELNVAVKKDVENKIVSKKQSAAGTKKPTGKAATAIKKTAGAEVAKNLLKSVNHVKDLNIISITTKSHGKVWFGKESRALVDRVKKEFYGILDDDDDTILPLDKETIRMLEAAGQNIRQTTTPKKQANHISRDAVKAATKKAKEVSEEEEVASSVDDEEEVNEDDDEELAASEDDDEEELSDNDDEEED
jgi:hypothetical protein